MGAPTMHVGRVRKATLLFAQSLLEAGARVKVIDRDYSGERQRDYMKVSGRGRFSALVLFDYERSLLSVRVLTKKGTQVVVEVASANELRVLFQVWDICSY